MKNTILLLLVCASPVIAASSSSSSAQSVSDFNEPTVLIRRHGLREGSSIDEFADNFVARSPYERSAEDIIKEFDQKEACRVRVCPNEKCAESCCVASLFSLPIIGLLCGGPNAFAAGAGLFFSFMPE